MKKEKNKQWLCLLTGISLLAALTACTGETLLSPSGEGKPVIVNAEISDEPVSEITSRALAEENTYDRSTFITNDRIRITRTTRTSKSEAIDYQLGADNQWTVATPLTLLAGASYQAVYPAGSDAGIMYDQSSAANYIKSNRLVSAIINAPATEKLNFSFGHQNTKLTLVFQPKQTGTLPADFSFQVSGAGLLTGGTTIEIIKLYHPGDLTWCGIVYPKGVSTSVSIKMTYDEVTYSSTIDCALAAGTHYKYTLQLHNDILVPEESNIAGWIDDNAHTGPLN